MTTYRLLSAMRYLIILTVHYYASLKSCKDMVLSICIMTHYWKSVLPCLKSLNFLMKSKACVNLSLAT